MNLILDKRYTNTVRACYLTSVSTSVTGNLSPLLFLTFRELYGLSFAEMGLLVLINFTTQLLVDLLFSFFSHRLSAERCVRATPLVIAAGLAVFALLPRLLPDAAMAGLVLGTVVFSAGSGLAEVLTSPTVSAVPSSNSERLLSRLHAAYAWGVVAVVPLSTLFLYFTDATLWWVLPLGFTVLPLVAALLFYTSPTPPVDDAHGEAEQGTRARLPRGVMALCFFCIFFGGAAECTMAQWCSGYIEEALGIPKLWGDIFGVALFGAALGLGRTLYSAFGMSGAATIEEAMAARSPIHQTDNMPDVKYTVFHCDADEAVNIHSHSEKFVAKMAEKYDITYHIVHGRGHCDLDDENRALYNAAAEKAILGA
jgi:fucose permease